VLLPWLVPLGAISKDTSLIIVEPIVQFARREPTSAFEFEASLFAFEHEIPLCGFALLPPRKTTRNMGNSTIMPGAKVLIFNEAA
jgi:hypothetical protein